jgi:hypothetical protein
MAYFFQILQIDQSVQTAETASLLVAVRSAKGGRRLGFLLTTRPEMAKLNARKAFRRIRAAILPRFGTFFRGYISAFCRRDKFTCEGHTAHVWGSR